MKKRVRAYMRNGRNRRFWKRLLSVLSCVVVFVTTYALLLPAVTLEKTAACGMEAHQHDQSCFEQHLICGLEETDGHQHTDDCYTVNRVLACTIEEHSHTEECFNEEGELTCALAEHSHDDGCWREDRVLSCKKEETEPHHHTDACYESVLVCQKPVHIHSAECYVERSLNLAQYLTGDTTIYVRAGDTGDGANGDADSGNADGEITDGAYAVDGGTYDNSGSGWLRVDDTAEITAIDIVRLHYAYTIPAGTLTEGNQTLRYALPDNVRLTDDQIREVNAMNGGRGAQAVEGIRTPDQQQAGDEYVSAWILFENVYKDSDKKHKDPIGQNLVLTFDAATIEKNRKVFGQDGALVDPGEEINGFFSIDINTDQISFDRGGDSDGEKETDVTLVEENKDLGIAPIRRTIRVIEAEEEQAEAVPEILNEEARAEEEFTAVEEDAVVEESAVSEDGAVTEENAAAEEDAVIEEDSDTEENAASVEDSAEEDVPAEEAVNGGEAPAEVLAKEGQEDLNQEEQDQEGKSSGEQAADSDKENEEKSKEEERTTIYQGVADTLTYEGADYTVTASYTEDAGIPEGASLVVSEITEDDDRKAFESYRGQAEEAVAQEPGRKVSWIRLFDITIEKNGKPIEPQDPVSVQITYHEAIEQAADTTVDTVHFEGKKETPKVLETAAEGTDTATEQVSFETDGFSVFAIVGTTIEKTVLASDGKNYRIIATYGAETGIPENVDLAVEEILPEENGDVNTSSAYDEYVSKTENALGWEAGSASYARVFDIKIVDKNDPFVKYQPKDGTSVDVRIELADAEKENDLNVVHFADADSEGDVVENSTEKDADGSVVEFAADGFSVYVIINHEGEEKIVTPRVEFHFIAEDFTGDGTYTASPYNFVNTGGDYQTTQILKNGESLELITNPPNIVIDNGDGTNSEKFFYGWYVVNASGDTATLNNTTGKYEGDITYTWPASDHAVVSFGDNLVINDSGNIKVGDTVSWTLGDISGTGEIDSEGRVHVYLAPLYEDFYFVNFRMGSKEDSTGLSNSLLERKMIVFGSGDTVTVRIGDVVCPSSDPQHKIFVGWETVVDNDGTLTRDTFYQTVDFDGNELDSPGSDDGYYIPVHKNTSTLTQVDLYPVFAEARWLKFNTGKSGNGAKYVGSAYRVTNDEGVGNYFDSTFFTGTGNNDSHLSSRAGYDFEGWYAFANMDSDGNITNLDEEQDVTISYLDEHGEKQTAAIRTKAVKMVNDDGSLAFEGSYTLDINGEDIKLFEVIDGKLYFYKAMDDLTLFANWKEKKASYRVIVWKQKVTDDVDATDDEKEYDYEIFYTSIPVDTGIEPDLTHFSGIYVDSDGVEHQVNNINLQNLVNNQQSYLSDFEGFHYDRNNVETEGNPNPDGTTVYDVYYDRNVHTLTFSKYDYAYSVSENDNDNSPAKYGDLNGQKTRIYWRNGAFRTSNANNGTIYNGIVYTRSTNQSWQVIKQITALYGQNIADQFPIHGTNGVVYDNGERWDPQSNNLGWNQVMVIVDSMPDEDVSFRLDTATRPLKTMNYYVQTLPGETGDVTYNGVTYKLYTSVAARYNGVTSEDFLELEGFSKNGWSSNGSTSPYSSTFYIYSQTQDQTINFYYLREQSDLTFDVNYPVDANLEYSNGRNENLTVPDIYYQDSLTEYGSSQVNGKTNWYYGIVDDSNTAQHELVGPDHYIFGGWYEDASCTVPFNFDSTMPVGNKIVYAKWEPEWFVMHIDPNGAEIDHINHENEFSRSAIPGERPADTGYDPSQSTYFWLSYGGVISEYSLSRNYVPISEAAAEQYDGQIYYYMNHQYSKELDGDFGLNANARNALYLTEEEIEQYYEHYADYAARAGVTVLDLDTWRQHYTSYGRQKYRIANGQEHYEFLGWYQVFNAGTEDEYLGDMPYVFTTPISNDLYLRAMWRLDGGYTIQYVPEYTMPDGAIINGEMENWNDPPTGNLSYSDGAATEIYKQPTDLTKNGSSIDDDSVIFLGWQLVSKSGTDDNPVYTPLEPGVYYDPSDPYTVNAANADADSIIYFQAVYQYREASDRRPVVKNLTLDANTGYVNTSDSADLPEWEYYPGTSAINTEDHLLGSNPTQIEFGDIQSSAAVHLYRYATELTEDAAGNAVTDANQFFEHPDGYFLLGFDDGPTEGDYIATYPADSVIAITRDENRTIYAVWEPMVYLTLKNETEVGPVTFNISSDSTEALEVINVRNGMYDRQPLSSLNNITLADRESITLAFPKGAEKYITISGTNTLGVGNVLIWNSSIDLAEEGTTYDTAVSGQDITYSHNEDESDTHTLVTGEVNNTKSFSFDERLIQNKNALTVTFTSRSNAYALVLDDNYPEGGIQEYDYSLEDITPDENGAKTQELPSTSTRIGYEFQGWAYSPTAETPDFSVDNAWTIPDLNATDGFFSTGTTETDGTQVRTLYAVWKAKADTQVVYVYKDVPVPGNQNEEFDFTVAISGTYHVGTTYYPINESSVFQLKHGWYLKITSSNDNATASGHTIAYVQSVVQVYDAEGNQQGSEVTVRWQKENISSSVTNKGFDSDLRITVTEDAETYYGTSVTRNAQTEANKLYLGDSTDVDTLPLTVDTNTTYWTNTDVGGTVVYTNTRQTHDISVEKILHSNTSAAAIFSFTASYTLDDGDPVDLGMFTVQSGTVNSDALKDIPAGAVLTITEVTDTNDIYTTTTSSEKNAADLNDDAKTISFTVSEDDTITFDNTLKSYPVTFRLVDQDGNTSINGMFSLSSSTGSLGTDLYASATSTNPPAGQFYSSDTFWADTYMLTQNIVPTSYIGPNGPVTLIVTGSGIVSSDPENVTVTWKDPDDHSQGYLITVINRATKKVTVKKVLEDPLLANTRQFGFSYSYTPQDSEGQPTGEAVTGSFTLSPVSNDENGVTYELAVPIHASLAVAEITTGDYASVKSTYDTEMTAVGLMDSDTDDGRVFTVSKVEDDGTITFTNTRKTQTINVKKVFEDTTDTTEVPFTATLMNGTNAISEYLVYGGGLLGIGALTTDDTGMVTFNLKHNEEQELIVPYGIKLVISETSEGYNAEINTTKNHTDEDSIDNSFTMTVTQDDTVTFTNKKNGAPVILKKIGVDSATQQTISENLGGAEFTIYMEDQSTIAEGQVEEDGETTTKKLRGLTSSNDTGVFFEGTLPTGTYYLHETGVPAGYYKLVDNLRITVSTDGKVEIFGQNGSETEEFAVESGVTTVTIKNYCGYALPSTGGPGTRSIYLLGIMLTGIARAGLVMRRKRKAA